MNQAVVIVAAGSGVRMGSSMPKQFLILSGKPILMHTIECFSSFNPSMKIILVLSADQIENWKNLITQYKFEITHSIVQGGSTRTLSVMNGLIEVPEDSIVGVHDGVRPFVSASLLKRCYDEAIQFGCSIPCIPVTETLRKINGATSSVADRNAFRIIQTPQCFQAKKLKEAYSTAAGNDFTDDATVFEHAGNPIHLCDGEKTNIKITVPGDLVIGAAMVR